MRSVNEMKSQNKSTKLCIRVVLGMWRSRIYRYLRSGDRKSFHNLGVTGRNDNSGWPLAGLLAASGVAAAGAATVYYFPSSFDNDVGRVTQCDIAAAAAAYSEDYLPSYGSSSDPLILPFSVDEPQAFLVPVVRVQPRNEQDEAEFEQSVRAFLACSPELSSNDEVATTDGNPNSSSTTTVSTTSLIESLLESRPSRLDKLRQTQKSKQCVTTDRSYFYTNPRINADKSDRFVLLAGPASQNLGLDIAQCLGVRLSEMQLGRYADGEISVQIEESVRGKSIFIVQSTESSDSIMELFLLISTLRRASAKTITVIIPYYGYARQDQRKNQRRESIAAADIALMLEEMGMDHVLCVDVHSEAILGFFSPRMAVEVSVASKLAGWPFHLVVCFIYNC
jgi:N-terminal domain of ribose phosphate pyrophosphokinase